MQSIEDLDLEARPTLMRLDLNVPLEGGEIRSDARIQAALPAIRAAMKQGAKLSVASHLGRPKGQRHAKFSLEPVGARLSELLGCDVLMAEDCIGDGVRGIVREQLPEQLVLLENLRFHKGETQNDEAFAKALARPYEYYINDAFGASHRKHASIVGAALQIHPHRCAGGPLLQKETQELDKLLDGEGKFVAIVGGAKVSDKLGVLQALLSIADTICVGGAMAYTFLKTMGHPVGLSRVEESQLGIASTFLEKARARDVKILLPSDHVGATKFSESASVKHLSGVTIPDDVIGLDIGPVTRTAYVEALNLARRVFWNGPMGVFEWDNFKAGTQAIADAVAACHGFTVVGGGDSVAAVEQAGVASKISHISTGGGASLEYIESRRLPGLEVLRRHETAQPYDEERIAPE